MITRYIDGGPDTAALLRRRQRATLESWANPKRTNSPDASADDDDDTDDAVDGTRYDGDGSDDDDTADSDDTDTGSDAPSGLDDAIGQLGDTAAAVFGDLDLSSDECLTKIAALLKMRAVLLDDDDDAGDSTSDATESHRARRTPRGRRNTRGRRGQRNALEQRRERGNRPAISLPKSRAELVARTEALFSGGGFAPPAVCRPSNANVLEATSGTARRGQPLSAPKSNDDLQRLTADLMTA